MSGGQSSSRQVGSVPMSIPAVSVAMPVFNGARFLAEAISSILDQTWGDLELIVCDDGSTDGSLDIARAFAARDSRVVVLETRHGGIAAAMNRALAAARGEYFAPMDQDDVALPDRLDRQVAFMVGNPDVALVGSAMRLMDEDGQPGRKQMRPLVDVAGAMLVSCAVVHPASLMRTSAVRDVGGYRELVPFAEDYDLWLRLMERFEIANMADVLLLKRIHGGAVTQDRGARAFHVVARTIVYLSHLSRTTSGVDFADDRAPAFAGAMRFLSSYLERTETLPRDVIYNVSRLLRYAPIPAGRGSRARAYWRYLGQAARAGKTLRTVWYLLLYFGFNRRRWDGLLAARFAASHPPAKVLTEVA